jgi:cell division protein FtsZ
VAEAAHPDANIIFGAMVDDRLEDQVWVTVVATGYGGPSSRRRLGEQDASRLERNGDRMREPRGEPRVSRIRERPARTERKADIRTPMELDVPEFIPRR